MGTKQSNTRIELCFSRRMLDHVHIHTHARELKRIIDNVTKNGPTQNNNTIKHHDESMNE